MSSFTFCGHDFKSNEITIALNEESKSADYILMDNTQVKFNSQNNQVDFDEAKMSEPVTTQPKSGETLTIEMPDLDFNRMIKGEWKVSNFECLNNPIICKKSSFSLNLNVCSNEIIPMTYNKAIHEI